METKFKIGDTVFYKNGQFGVKECKVHSVETEAIPGVPFTSPIYQISWQPTGWAAAHEKEIFSNREEAA